MATQGFRFNHTMFRVKDPKISIDFYTRIMGMELIDSHEASDFTLYFLAFDTSKGTKSTEEKKDERFTREGVLELTYNHGTEKEEGAVYSNGNSDPGRGFGHIAITVPDIGAACEYFENMGVRWKKRLTDGKMHNIAFILDPDNYWVEIVENKLKLN